MPGGGSMASGATVTLFLCGDVMTGRGVDQILRSPVDPAIREPVVQSALDYVALAERASGPIPRQAAPEYVWGEAPGEIDRERPDVRLINLETAVTTSARRAPKGINYRMSPANASCLRAARIDCCVLANNHVLDWGAAGLEETLRVLHAAGIRTAGAGRILALRRAGDLVVVSIHWGGNRGYEVSREERAFAHRLIDRGAADLVHGHSSHHPGPVEIRRERAILYRCGDLLNDYEGISGYEGYRPELALLYFATLDAVTGALRALRLAPVRIRRFRLERADGADAEWLAATLDRESRGFGTRIELGPDGRLHVHAAAEACARSTPGGAGAG
jgi:poly-gamma-glutamate synthesis protein (capsule biosynthesis protein)